MALQTGLRNALALGEHLPEQQPDARSLHSPSSTHQRFLFQAVEGRGILRLPLLHHSLRMLSIQMAALGAQVHFSARLERTNSYHMQR